MKINGTEVKGIKKAMGDYNKDKINNVILYYTPLQKVVVFSREFYNSTIKEVYGADNLFINLTDIINDAYPENYKISMVTIQAVLREYVL